MIVVGCKVLHFINDKDQEVLGYKTLWYTNVVASYREKINFWSLYPRMTALKISHIYMSMVVRKETLNKYINMGWNSDTEIPNS